MEMFRRDLERDPRGVSRTVRQNAAVAMKWSALFDKEIPQELLAEIELQKDTCERIIQSKDRLIKEFKAELKAKVPAELRAARTGISFVEAELKETQEADMEAKEHAELEAKHEAVLKAASLSQPS